MRGANIAGVYTFFVIFYSILAQKTTSIDPNQGAPSIVPAPEQDPPANTEEIEDNKAPRDQHTFVALLDLVFTDQGKRTCTGAIIHDYVVVTAAHCFIKANTIPELTISFVVIGTKKMFDTGYEQYLPIERYKIHPKFKGWTADLALVYTFAAMTADKPGKVLPLAGEKVINPVDTSITVLSWGKSSERHAFQQGIHVTQIRSGISSKRDNHDLYGTVRIKSIKRRSKHKPTEKVFPQNRIKPYFSNWRRKMGTQQNNLTVEVFHFTNVQSCKKIVEDSMPSIYVINIMRSTGGYVEIAPKNAEGNDVVCYKSDDYFVAIEDSGAPAIRYGRLFAITVGGVESEGEHLAIGMRMACYCSWIAANLPSDGNMMDCCKNCCTVVHKPPGSGRSGPKTYRGYFEDRVQ